MSTEVTNKITPTLHPDTVKSIVDEYDEDTEAVLAPTMTAFSEAYEGLRQVHDAREKAKTNPSWTEAEQVMRTQDLADKVMAKVTRTFDNVRGNLVRGIASLEEQLSQPVESKASGSIAAEVRAHLKGLPSGERMSVLREAINSGDHTVATAALGAPAMLSGLDANMAKVLLREYHTKHQPQMAKRLAALTAARDKIERDAGKLFPAMEKAVGMAPHKVKALREARSAAEAAFILKDA
jgi:hypothetical protein